MKKRALLAAAVLMGMMPFLACAQVQAAPCVPILVYHQIGPTIGTNVTPMTQHYHIDTQTFLAQMQYLKDNGYTPITLADLVNHYTNGTAIPAKAVVLTFDDGWKNQYTYAYPILEQFGYTATFFIITSYATDKYPAYMQWPQILDLDRSGMEIGSHTVDHVNLTKVTPLDALQEVVDSKRTLEAELGHPVTVFAYPQYGYNAGIEQMLQRAGYVAARAGWVRGTNGTGNLFALKSQEVINNDDPFTYAGTSGAY